MITSMREHKGWLYLGGVSNNRIGRYRIPGADPDWTAHASYRGRRLIGVFHAPLDPLRGAGVTAITVPPMDGALQPERSDRRGAAGLLR